MRRIASLWFPRWPIDARRWRQGWPDADRAPGKNRDGGDTPGGGAADSRPFALIATGKGGLRLTAVNAAAAAEGLRPGMTLAGARAALPHLAVAEAEPAADAQSLGQLADWCSRWTPWTATDGSDGIVLDVSGCAHLFGGEPALLQQMAARLQPLGFTVRAALADTPAAAWAWARYGTGGVLASGAQMAALAPLPVAALRLPAAMVHGLERLGLKTIGALAALPRAPIARRFGTLPLQRLDQAAGRQEEPVGPRRPAPDWSRAQAFAEPIGRAEDIAAAAQYLLQALTADLARAERGVRQLILTVWRIDGGLQRLGIGTAQPTRAVPHLARLLREPLQTVDAGAGIEVLALTAAITEPLPATQLDWQRHDAQADALVRLLDRLQQRLGAGSVGRLAPIDSHLPERAQALAPPPRTAAGNTVAAPPAGWPRRTPRPLRLLPAPEPIAVMAPVPDDPPLSFRWRHQQHRVARAEGPERIAAEWWRAPPGTPARDYYWVEDTAGRRYWLFRDGPYASGQPARWYLHGLFA